MHFFFFIFTLSRENAQRCLSDLNAMLILLKILFLWFYFSTIQIWYPIIYVSFLRAYIKFATCIDKNLKFNVKWKKKKIKGVVY